MNPHESVLKICRVCGLAKKEIEFTRQYNSTTNLCKYCSAQRSREWRKANQNWVRKASGSRANADASSKTCTKCKKLKPIDSFSRIKRSNTARHSWCKACCAVKMKEYKRLHPSHYSYANMNESQRAAYYAAQRRWIARNPGQVKGFALKRFGIDLDRYERMLEAQGGVCAICRKHETLIMHGKVRGLAVDHCHKTGKVRGLLCSNCNAAIGYMRDDPATIRACADYLERAK